MYADGHVLPFEYQQTTFTNTFEKYFPEHIKNWFKLYSDKHTLVCNNTKPRVFVKGDDDFLNLFSGYKYDKTATKDTESINRGSEGVKL